MPECSLPGRPRASTVFAAEPPAGGEQASSPPGRGLAGGGVPGTVLAFDFGTKRIGVALGTLLAAGAAGPARPLATIDAADNATRFAAIAALIAEWQPVRLLVGRPLNDDGTPHAMTARCERFAQQLRGRFRLCVDAVDERYSSLAAESALRGRGHDWRGRRARLDAEAALIILRSWFDEPPAAA